MSKQLTTEDDTFRILARPGIREMVRLHSAWMQEHRDRKGIYNQTKNIEFAKYYGWTWLEYLDARHKERMSPIP